MNRYKFTKSHCNGTITKYDVPENALEEWQENLLLGQAIKDRSCKGIPKYLQLKFFRYFIKTQTDLSLTDIKFDIGISVDNGFGTMRWVTIDFSK